MPSKRIAIFSQRRERQRGAGLLIIMVLLIVALAAALLNSLTSSTVKAARQQKTSAALAQAKAALIGYAITYGDTHSNQVPGYLPCPDTDGNNGLQAEGIGEYSTSSCNSNPSSNQDVSVIGRLPWKTLDLSDLRDGDGECLWYAVSGTYKNNPPTGLMNWDTNGQFQVNAPDGTQLASQVVAVIFAPGAALPGQDRSDASTPPVAPVCGGNYTAASYLDTGTVNTVSYNNANISTGNFIQGTSGGSINDQMVFITRQDIWNAVMKRTDFQPTNPNNPLIQMTNQVALCLAKYALGYQGGPSYTHNFNYSMPWPAPLVLSDYSVNTNYQDSASTLYAGRVPYNISNSNFITTNKFPLPGNLMTTASCGSGWTSSIDIWWNNWKDHLFYAVGKTYRPTTNQYQSCFTCVQVNSSGLYAAVVMFAGPRLSNQTRANKSVVTDYLESTNASNFPDTTHGNRNYTSGAASPTFNDVLYCIDSNLNVGPC
jgi:type II secretory pathway pseudopilin PulG